MRICFLFIVICLTASSYFCQAAQAVEDEGTAGHWPVLHMQTNNTGAVRALQYLLKAQGYSLNVDGRFGNQTEAVLYNFQNRQKHHTAGNFASVDAYTWEALIADLKRGDIGMKVRALQCLLQANGYKVFVDGQFGPQTQRAVLRFQQSHDMLGGVIAPGQVEHFTWCQLSGGQHFFGGAC